MLTGVAIALSLAFVAVCGTLWALQDRLIFPAPTAPLPFASASGEVIELGTADGERLAALWHPPESGEPIVLFLHGNGTAIATMGPVVDALADAGFGVLMPAWRGYPGSTGRPSEAGILLDAEAAHDFAAAFAARAGAAGVAVYGQSLGTGAAVHLASTRAVRALVLEASYDSVLAVASGRFPVLPVAALLRHPFRSDRRIGGVEAPILIHHGTADRVIPIAHGRALHALAPEGARLNEVEGASHFNIGALTLDATIRFLREAAAPGGREATGDRAVSTATQTR